MPYGNPHNKSDKSKKSAKKSAKKRPAAKGRPMTRGGAAGYTRDVAREQRRLQAGNARLQAQRRRDS